MKDKDDLNSIDDVRTSSKREPLFSHTSWLINLPWWLQAVLVLVITFVKNGAGPSPNASRLIELAVNWQHPIKDAGLHGSATYLLSSPTSAVVAGILGFTSANQYFAFHCLLVICTIIGLFALPRVRASPEIRGIVVILFLASGVSSTLFSWIGSYDPVSVAAGGVGVLSKSAWIRTIAWAIFAFNNLPQAGLAFACYCLIAASRWNWRRFATREWRCLLGLAFGAFAILSLESYWGSSIFSRLTYHNAVGFSNFVAPITHYFPLILFSGLGSGWLLLFHHHIRHERGVNALVLLGVVMAVLVSLIALDESRTLTVVLFPSLMWFAVETCSTLPSGQVRAIVDDLLWPSIFLPVLLVWSGSIVYPGFASGIKFVHGLF